MPEGDEYNIRVKKIRLKGDDDGKVKKKKKKKDKKEKKPEGTEAHDYGKTEAEKRQEELQRKRVCLFKKKKKISSIYVYILTWDIA